MNQLPALYISHGAPPLLEDDLWMSQLTEWSQGLTDLSGNIAKPKAILIVSAHWESAPVAISSTHANTPLIYDFGGFAPKIYNKKYGTPDASWLGDMVAKLMPDTEPLHQHPSRGLDHGAWVPLKVMYPAGDIPVLQLSIDYTREGNFHFELAKEMKQLRKRGVLIIGSGNMVHNLRMVDWAKLNEPGYGYDWALEINDKFKTLIMNGIYDDLIHYNRLGTAGQLAIPTPEHYLPLLYTLGASNSKDPVEFFNDRAIGGSLTMTSVKYG